MAKKKKEVKEAVSPKVRQEITPEKERSVRSRLFQGYLIIMLLLFIALAVGARLFPYFSPDILVTKEIQEVQNPIFDLVMKAVSYIGYPPQVFVLILPLLILFILGLRWGAFIGLLGLIFSTASVTGIKDLVGRSRPSANLVHVTYQLTSPDFPSGHVVVFTVLFGYLAFLSYTLIERKDARSIAFFIFSILVLLVGPSRIYLGAHWTSDVIGAYLLGTIILSLMIYLYEWGKDKYFVKKTMQTFRPM